jgi:hypothetical protein
MNVHWQKGLSLEETLEEGRTHKCPWAGGGATGQHSKEGHECSLAEGAVAGRNIRRGEDKLVPK